MANKTTTSKEVFVSQLPGCQCVCPGCAVTRWRLQISAAAKQQSCHSLLQLVYTLLGILHDIILQK